MNNPTAINLLNYNLKEVSSYKLWIKFGGIIEAFNISYNIHDTSFNHDILFLHYICYKLEESENHFRH
eukprot:Pgem_evm1s15819